MLTWIQSASIANFPTSVPFVLEMLTMKKRERCQNVPIPAAMQKSDMKWRVWGKQNELGNTKESIGTVPTEQSTERI